MAYEDAQKAFKAYGGTFRWGSGLLGKSAIVVGPLIIGLLILAWHMQSDWARFGLSMIAVATFFGWYIPFIQFCEKHPADALLEGIHWAEHQQHLLAAKGQPTISIASQASLSSNKVTNPSITDGDKVL